MSYFENLTTVVRQTHVCLLLVIRVMQYCYKFQTMSRSTSNLGSGDLFIPSTPAKESHDLLLFEEQKDRNPAWALIKDRPLETCHDVLCDTNTFQVTEDYNTLCRSIVVLLHLLIAQQDLCLLWRGKPMCSTFVVVIFLPKICFSEDIFVTKSVSLFAEVSVGQNIIAR